MAEIYGRMPSGSSSPGWRFSGSSTGQWGLVSCSPHEVADLKPAFDSIYSMFAKNRLKLTGRCEDDSCSVPQT